MGAEGRRPLLLRGLQKSKLVIIVVGLPGRGKTFLCNKLKCYLNWWVQGGLKRAFPAAYGRSWGG